MKSFVKHWLTPHYSNNHRPKLIQPYGLAVLVALFIVIETSVQLLKFTPRLPGGFVLGYASSITPSQVVEMTNSERSKNGLPPLQVDERLNQAAIAKANHMFQHDYWAHIAPDGTSPWVFIKKAGYAYTVAGENLARDFNDTPSMIDAWLNSPTHKANIVHQKYSQIGVGVVNGKLQGVETTLVVQLFGNPSFAAAAPQTKAVSTQPLKTTAPAAAAAPEPVVEAVPENNPEPAPVVVPVSQLTEISQPLPTATNSKIISPQTLVKIISSVLIAVLVSILAYDSIIMNKRNLPRKVGNNWAHIAFFGIILIIVMAITEGSVL